MSKIKSIKLKNFKAIESAEVDFNGCTAIIMAGNDMGKTSLLRGIPDRIRFNRPEIMVHKGAEEGSGEMELTTGEKFIWKFDNNGTDKLTYITELGVKSNVTVAIGERFFPSSLFDVDKFLNSTPKEQRKQLQQIVGIDFTEIDEEYRLAYNERKTRNEEAERHHVKLSKMLEIETSEVQFVDLTELLAKKDTEKKRLDDVYLFNKTANDNARKKWQTEKDKIDSDVLIHNTEQEKKQRNYDLCVDAHSTLIANGYKGNEIIEWLKEAKTWIAPLKVAKELYPAEPTYIEERGNEEELNKIDGEILAASETNSKAKKWVELLTYKADVKTAKELAEQADEAVKSIELRRNKMIADAKFPKGIAMTEVGITIDGLPFDRKQISTSKLYTTALRIASMNLGEVKTLYFDASFLDKNTLGEIEIWANSQKWAGENGLQLLIERPDYEGGPIKYELIEII